MASDLPCDADGACMACKVTPPVGEALLCRTCATPWHVPCLSRPPESLASTVDWNCPDCSLLTAEMAAKGPSAPASASAELVAAVRVIEADETLTEQEKARRRQFLLSGGNENINEASEEDLEEKKAKRSDDVLDLLDGSINCSFCMQLPERPVTTPCGHNFCLKCFQKWVGQRKLHCAKCRSLIPSKFASHPRINSTLALGIRMAKSAKSGTSSCGQVNAYHFIRNENRPDKAFTTERAKRAGKANACSGQIFVTTPPDHFGPITAEYDPKMRRGVLVGDSWDDRMDCRQWGAHLPHVAGIAGQSDYGAQSVALSGGYEDDEDHGEWFLYTGRSHKEKRSSYAPENGVRYDGIYRIEKCWRKVGFQGFKVCRYLFVRCDNEPAPWTSDEHGDRPRPLPVIKELKNATDVTERKDSPSWDYNEERGWMWMKDPPVSRRPVFTVNEDDQKRVRKAIRLTHNISVREKLLKEFNCLICRKVLSLPLTTPCAHNFCKLCLLESYADKSFVRERTRADGRSLRSQKITKNCPACPTDISDFLQNPRVNRELMGLIESLQHKTEESLAAGNEVIDEEDRDGTEDNSSRVEDGMVKSDDDDDDSGFNKEKNSSNENKNVDDICEENPDDMKIQKLNGEETDGVPVNKGKRKGSVTERRAVKRSRAGRMKGIETAAATVEEDD
ncbi:E3 ubiquitin-protein ligase ORTHRUS 2 [Apostasia shenzhenica]|uniref:RING-type E3 ubiquitin transferase n=1 Tax=Apostasia shenzhenica TaxID=1088818 RepID=A0A2H9ZWE1_9ASPA|nr:E3 ubiquitin-protein ligase ORTHRUS 2 [Apostasia shenzhenica]